MKFQYDNRGRLIQETCPLDADPPLIVYDLSYTYDQPLTQRLPRRGTIAARTPERSSDRCLLFPAIAGHTAIMIRSARRRTTRPNISPRRAPCRPGPHVAMSAGCHRAQNEHRTRKQTADNAPRAGDSPGRIPPPTL